MRAVRLLPRLLLAAAPFARSPPSTTPPPTRHSWQPQEAQQASLSENSWELSAEPVLSAGPNGTFDEIAVKDPSVVYYEGAWHVFYTARGNAAACSTGYVSAPTMAGLRSAPRHELAAIKGKATGKGRYGCAPQVFFFRPHAKWYLIFQSTDSNYQPAYSSTATIAQPDSWAAPEPLIRKDSTLKWIDFWVIADSQSAHLFYTESQHTVMVRTTPLSDFPRGWGAARPAFTPVSEAAHIYKVKGEAAYHMVYELHDPPGSGVRSFGLATARNLTGPWTSATTRFATGTELSYHGPRQWTDMVSHGEGLRSGSDELLEYDPTGASWLIQGTPRANLKKFTYANLCVSPTSPPPVRASADRVIFQPLEARAHHELLRPVRQSQD